MRFTFAVILLFLSTNLNSQTNTKNNISSVIIKEWKLISAPTKNSFHKIVMLSPTEGFIFGKYIIKLINGKWQLSYDQPPVSSLNVVSVANENNIWVASNNKLNSSDFFYYNGKQWKKTYFPLANQITEIANYNRKLKWVVGDRELAKFDNGKWKFINYPNSPYTISKFHPFGEQIYCVVNGAINHYDGKIWKETKLENIVKDLTFIDAETGYALLEDKIYKFQNKKWFPVTSSTLLKQTQKIKALKNGEIWGIGKNGFVIHFSHNIWRQVKVPTDEDLYDIALLNQKNIWIVGNNGTILQYTTNIEKTHHKNISGFEINKIIPTSKEISDEYGVAIGDFNNDGLKDIYTVCIFDPNRLYVNTSEFDLTKKITRLVYREEAGLRNVTGVSTDSSGANFLNLYLGVSIADVDNDGYDDIYLCSLSGKNKLYLNTGNGDFREVSKQKNRACDSSERTNSSIWGDVDNDGDLDLFLTDEYSTNRLFLNNGNGYFYDATESCGLKSTYGGMSASFGDIDNDGKLDLCVVNWGINNLLYKNITDKNGNVKFKNISYQINKNNLPASKSNSVNFADIDNDGDLDLFITNRRSTNRIFENDGFGNFNDKTKKMLGLDSLLSYGSCFADFDNDGFVDLFVGNIGGNKIYKNIDGLYFKDYSEIFGSYYDGYSTGCASGDVDNDGDIDLYVSNYINGNSVLYRNNLNTPNSIIIDVQGTKSNRDGIGTKIWIYKAGQINKKNGLEGFREINGGSGYASYSAKEAFFGLRNVGKYDAVVYFPASKIEKRIYNISTGNKILVTEESDFNAELTLIKKLLYRLFIDPEIHRELAKFIIVSTLILLSIFWGIKKYRWKGKHLSVFHLSIILFYWIGIASFYDDSLFLSTLLPISFVVISLAFIHLIYERVIMVKVNKMEKQATRDRIARDLHDDLASTLSSSLIYTSALKNTIVTTEKETNRLLQKIEELLTNASEAITDIVWTVSPMHDKLEDLIIRLKSLISESCRTNKIKFSNTINVEENSLLINDETRRNIYLIFKEAMHNSLKHSKASKVNFHITFRHKEFNHKIF